MKRGEWKWEKKKKKEEEIEKWRDIKNSFSCCEVELLGCCHATDGLWEFCCTMMTVALAGREQPEFKSTHYECVCVCACECVFFVCLSPSIWSKLPPLRAASDTREHAHTHTHTLSWTIKPEHNSIQSSNRIFNTL